MIVACTDIDRKVRIKGNSGTADRPILPGCAVNQWIRHLFKIVNIRIIADNKRRDHLVPHHKQAGRCAVLGEVERLVARDSKYVGSKYAREQLVGADLRERV